MEWELQRKAGSDRWRRFQGIMLTLAAGINNLEEERNDLSLPAHHSYRVMDFHSSLLTLASLVIVKYLYLLSRMVTLCKSITRWIHRLVCFFDCCFSQPSWKWALSTVCKHRGGFHCFVVEFKIFITYTPYFWLSEGKAWKLHNGLKPSEKIVWNRKATPHPEMIFINHSSTFAENSKNGLKQSTRCAN